MTYLNSCDKKIFEWDRSDFAALVDSFTADELAEMQDYLEYVSNRYDGYDRFRYTCEKVNNSHNVVYDYIRRILYEKIGDGSYNDGIELLDIVLAIQN